jgi:hypothetical protein
MYGIAGAHRTGKTTLAKAIAEKLGIHYHDASVSKIMKECGIDGVRDVPLADRITLQEFILDKFIDAIKAAPRPAICDRTPLDMIGYMLGELTMHNTPVELHEQIQFYAERCLVETTLHFDTVLTLRPLPDYAVEAGKPPFNRAYQSMVQFIIEGACSQSDYLHAGVISATNFERRLELACGVLSARRADLAEVMSHFSIN